ATREVPVAEVNWLGDGVFEGETLREIEVKVRSTRPPTPAILTAKGPFTGSVTLAVAEEGVSPGQACVFYEPGTSRVLGGGWITR
ncbi:MAG: aminomethyltransferase beta-barrel domain-containing protein, partial [Shimia sp.]